MSTWGAVGGAGWRLFQVRYVTRRVKLLLIIFPKLRLGGKAPVCMRRAASGGALAPQPPRATGSDQSHEDGAKRGVSSHVMTLGPES